MIKNIVRLEHKIGDRIYHFFCDNDAPASEAHEALANFTAFVLNVLHASKAKDENASSPEQEKVEEKNG